MAAPEVAGTAALIWAARPDLENYQVADIIKQSAQPEDAPLPPGVLNWTEIIRQFGRREPTPGWTPTSGCGLLNPGNALELAISEPAAASSDGATSGSACSAEGNAPPTWPTEANQTITFNPLPDKTLDHPAFKLRATASSGLPVSFTTDNETDNCIFTDAVTVHLQHTGTCTITATQEGNTDYNAAPAVTRSFTITARRKKARCSHKNTPR
jgi:hypothetical protein